MPRKYKYDVFISYRQQDPDKDWVRQTLLPQLKQMGVKVCTDFNDFELGADLISEMEKAVNNSKYTVGVFTPRYLESEFTKFENILAQYLSLETGSIRFLAILRENCTPSLRVRAKLWLDMTNDDEFLTQVERLVEQIRRSD